jgi:hypothetical protein
VSRTISSVIAMAIASSQEPAAIFSVSCRPCSSMAPNSGFSRIASRSKSFMRLLCLPVVLSWRAWLA